MSTAKVIEIIAEGATVEEAVQNGVNSASKTLHGIKGVWVEGIKAGVKDGKVTGYRVDLKVTFILDD